MLRLIFWTLLLANVALFAFHQGVFGSPSQGRREPERIQSQLNEGQLKLLPAGAVSVPAATVAEKEDAQLVECIEIGNFSLGQVKRIEERLALLGLGQNQTRVNVEEVTNHMVLIPSQGGKAAADRKVAEIQRLGVKNYYVISDNNPYRWGISLGVFKSEQAARNHLAELNRKGITGIRIVPRNTPTDSVLYRLRDLNTTSVRAVDKLMEDFPEQNKHECQK